MAREKIVNTTTTSASLKHCPKCGAGSVRLEYHDSIKFFRRFHNTRRDEHLHFICCACGYDWTEDCLDKENDDGDN